MSEQEKIEFNPHLFNLINMFTRSAWSQLGKLPNPIDNKITKDLNGANITIEMLIMLRDKMKGNLTKKEEEVLSGVISELQLNYAAEAEKQSEEEKKN